MNSHPCQVAYLDFLVAKRKATIAFRPGAISQQKMHYHSKSQQRDWTVSLLSYQSPHPPMLEACFPGFASAPPGSLTSQPSRRKPRTVRPALAAVVAPSSVLLKSAPTHSRIQVQHTRLASV